MGTGGQTEGGGDNRWRMGAIQLSIRVPNERTCLSVPPLPQATCQAVGGGQRVCTCPSGYGGDGFSCYGDIFQVSLGRGSLMNLRWEGAALRPLGVGGGSGLSLGP